MAHLALYLPAELELGPVRRDDWGTQVVTTDGGFEHRNNRWDSPRRSFEISYPPSLRDGTVHQAVLDLYEAAEGMLHSFNYRLWSDETGETVLKVRFNGPMELTGLATHLDQVTSLSLIEVFE
jgi:uncharacterized protein (TIGR02217 family)